MKNLSKEDEGRAMGALKAAVSMANEGTDPSDALAKAAEDAQLPPQLTQRLVEAFNTSKTLSHYKKASDGEKAKSFPLADPAVVMEKLYPEQPETVQTKAAEALHPDYWVGSNTVQSLTKAAAATLPPIGNTTPPEPYERDPAAFAKSALDFRNRLSAGLAHVEETYRGFFNRMMGQMDKLAAYWKQVRPVESFELVEKRAYARYGKPAKTFMDMIYAAGDLGNTRLSVKRASADDLGKQEMVFPVDEEPYFHVASAMLFADVANTFRKEAGAIRDLMHDHTIKNVHFLPPGMVEDSINYVLDKEAKDKKKDMPDFLDQDRPKKVKEIYKALKRDHPDWPAGKKARIANAAADKAKDGEEKKASAPLSELF